MFKILSSEEEHVWNTFFIQLEDKGSDTGKCVISGTFSLSQPSLREKSRNEAHTQGGRSRCCCTQVTGRVSTAPEPGVRFVPSSA